MPLNPWQQSWRASSPRSCAMTIDRFLETDVLASAEDFFGGIAPAARESRYQRRSSRRVSDVPAKVLRTAIAVVALGLFAMNPRGITASTAQIDLRGARESGAA